MFNLKSKSFRLGAKIRFIYQIIVTESHLLPLTALRISRFPPMGPGSLSTVNPARCILLLTSPLAQYVLKTPLGESEL